MHNKHLEYINGQWCVVNDATGEERGRKRSFKKEEPIEPEEQFGSRIYLESFVLNTEERAVYPYKIIYPLGLRQIDFAPITIFYGSNGSGKSTLLNIIADNVGVKKKTTGNTNAYFKSYVKTCSFQSAYLQSIPDDSAYIRSEDIMDGIMKCRRRYASAKGVARKESEKIPVYSGKAKKMVDNLRANGVNADFVRTVEGVPTGIAIITVGENDNTIIVIAGANAKVDRAYVDSVKEELLTYDMVVLQHEIPLDTVHYIVDLCCANKIPVVLNPAPAAEVPADIIEKVTWLTPNEHEAVLIFGEGKTTEELLLAYPEKLVITQGSRGVSTGLKSGQVLNVPVRPAKVADTSGAGDTLNGAFCVRIAMGDSVADALRYANTAASLSTEKFGAQGGMPTAAEVEKALKETAG